MNCACTQIKTLAGRMAVIVVVPDQILIRLIPQLEVILMSRDTS
jgi:hypothetical protein